MFQAAERLKVQIMVWGRWRFSQHQMLESLRLFEATEEDSAWQLLQATEHLPESHLKAELFGQIMEESFHAEEFRRVYKELSGKSMERLQTQKRPLYPSTEAKSIFAYCLIGEASAAQRFSHIASALKDGPLKQTLNRILSDEVGHIHKAQEILETLEMRPQTLKKKLLQIQFQRTFESWLRMGRQITDVVANLFLIGFYYIFTGLFAGLLKIGRQK